MPEIKEGAEQLEQVVQAVEDSGAEVGDVQIKWRDDDSTEFWIVGDLDGGEA